MMTMIIVIFLMQLAQQPRRQRPHTVDRQHRTVPHKSIIPLNSVKIHLLLWVRSIQNHQQRRPCPTWILLLRTMFNRNSIQQPMVCHRGDRLEQRTHPQTILGSSPYSGQFIRSGQASEQLSYAGAEAYYEDDLGNGVDSLQQPNHHSQSYSHLQQRNRSSLFPSVEGVCTLLSLAALYSPPTPANHHSHSHHPQQHPAPLASPTFTLHHTPQSQPDYRHPSYEEASRYIAETSTHRTSTSPIYDNGNNPAWPSNEPQHYYGLPTAYAPISASNLNELSFQQAQLSANTDQIQFWSETVNGGPYIQCIGMGQLNTSNFDERHLLVSSLSSRWLLRYTGRSRMCKLWSYINTRVAPRWYRSLFVQCLWFIS